MARHAKIGEAKTRLSALLAEAAAWLLPDEEAALARGHRLPASDASYLARASREGCPLASLDRRLNEAAAAEGVAPFA